METEKSFPGAENKYREISDLPGMGQSTAEKLKKAGYATIESLATASVKELTHILGEKSACSIITEARKSLIAVPFMRADEYLKMRSLVERLTTGSKAFDSLLGGGLETQSITEVYGEFGTGKSQLCHQLCVNAQFPSEKGGLDGGVLYIDSESTFRPERIIQIAKRFDLDADKILSKIIYAEALTADHQMYLLDSADSQLKENNIRLIILDSLVAHFRSEYIGRESLAERQQKLDKHLHKLVRLARAFNATAVITNQVMAKPDAFLSDVISPVGGHILAHASHTRIFMRKASSPRVRIVRLIVSPNLPEGGECLFKITENGIEDIRSNAKSRT
ncbi:MAG: DNA repair and recombination protein RadA [Candidatus Bathyarchaeota archaeon]